MLKFLSCLSLLEYILSIKKKRGYSFSSTQLILSMNSLDSLYWLGLYCWFFLPSVSFNCDMMPLRHLIYWGRNMKMVSPTALSGSDCMSLLERLHLRTRSSVRSILSTLPWSSVKTSDFFFSKGRTIFSASSKSSNNPWSSFFFTSSTHYSGSSMTSSSLWDYLGDY